MPKKGRRNELRPFFELSVVHVVFALRASCFFHLGEVIQGTGKLCLELIPFRALLAACGFPFTQLILGQAVELNACLGQLRHRIRARRGHFDEVLV